MKFESTEAAVFYIDILGMGALTQGAVDLDSLDNTIYKSIYNVKIKGKQEISSKNQYVATWTLMRFRELLVKIEKKYQVNISQLSDCAFLWSENTDQLLLAASELMWKATLTGILCRGGLSYGEVIIQSYTNISFGQFILGDAVSRAAKAETSGKGCRIFSDPNSIAVFHKYFPGKAVSAINSNTIYNRIFSPITNQLDFNTVDEFRWYLYYDLNLLLATSDEINNSKMAMYMAALITVLRFSPYYAWNSLSKDGIFQLAASIEIISSAISVHTNHDDARLGVDALLTALKLSNRSNEIVRKVFPQYGVDALTKDIQSKMTDALLSKGLMLLEKNMKD